jgi:GMP synthase (glutamine-hydrolysing)
VVVLVVDNLSPFTRDILLCLERLKTRYTCKKFYEITDYENDSFEKIILSGRSKPSRDTNIANTKIILNCRHIDTPILGICYGAEIMALALGGSIRRMMSPVREMTRVLLSRSAEVYSMLPKRSELYVYESHAYCVSRIPEQFVSIATSKYCKNEIFLQPRKKLVGVQFHPEKSGDDGLTLLSDFLCM